MLQRTIMLIPIGINVSLTNINIGLAYAIKCKNIKLNIFKPIENSYEKNIYDHNIKIFYQNLNIPIIKAFTMSYAESLIYAKETDKLMMEIFDVYHSYNTKDIQLTLIEGLTQNLEYQLIDINNMLNNKIAKILNAEIIFITDLNQNLLKNFNKQIKFLKNSFEESTNKNIIGIIIDKLNFRINKLNFYPVEINNILNLSKNFDNLIKQELKFNISLPIIGYITYANLSNMSIIDICNQINIKIINKNKNLSNIIQSVFFYIHDYFNIKKYFYLPNNCLLVIPGENFTNLTKSYYNLKKLINIKAIIVTDNKTNVINLLNQDILSHIPIFATNDQLWQVIVKLQHINFNKTLYHEKYIHKIKEHVANCLDQKRLNMLVTSQNNLNIKNQLLPITFLYNITQLAKKYCKRIILPEGDDLRTIQAANFCTKNNIASCILLGNPTEIKKIAQDQNIVLCKNIDIIDPEKIRDNYVERLITLRKSHNMNETIARKQLTDNVTLATMMLDNNEIDGLVSGAVNTTANTIRPALQLIKTAKNNSLVSSIFFMLFKDKVIIFGDCAINQNPNADQLAEIAIQSADSAKYFGIIPPRIAMLSYSTGNSSFGPDVDKVKKATKIVLNKRPDLIIDGPLQYDTAMMKDIAKFKAPNSPVAGSANILIFPELNSGNITYKAVQRSANAIAIGPILQGMRKPVNDLSRGSLIDDIIYTITITAIQATVL